MTQATIAVDPDMMTRVAQCAAEQGAADDGFDPDFWAQGWRRVWSAAPGWDDAWESALASGNQRPGADAAVITDAQILSQVQAMKPFRQVVSPIP